MKFWGRRQGFANMKFFFIMDETNENGQRVVSVLGEDFHVFLDALRSVITGKTSPIDVLLYKEESSEWSAIGIVDEFEIVRRLGIQAYSRAMKIILEHPNCRSILIPFKQSEGYINRLLQTFNEGCGSKLARKSDLYVLRAEILEEEEQ